MGAGLTFCAASMLLPSTGPSPVVGAVLLAGALWTILWWRSDGKLRISIRNRQVKRETARGRVKGPLAFGFLLGLGWWTFVTTPLFWTGLVSSALVGKPLLGAVSFALARSWTAWYGALLPRGGEDATRTVTTIMYGFAPPLRRLNAVISVALLIIGGTVLVLTA
jgi:hypothetical protein